MSELTEVPSTTNPLGVKAAGEAGATGAPPAVIGAILDALQAARRRPHRHAGDAVARLGGDAKCSNVIGPSAARGRYRRGRCHRS